MNEMRRGEGRHVWFLSWIMGDKRRLFEKGIELNVEFIGCVRKRVGTGCVFGCCCGPR